MCDTLRGSPGIKGQSATAWFSLQNDNDTDIYVPTPQLHPLHEGFLWYYHAICYECMGLSVHNFSRNKVRFLELASDGLDTALKVLPLPYATSALEDHQEHDDSPPASKSPTKAVHYHCDVHSPPTTPCANASSFPVSNSIGSIYSIQTCAAEPDSSSSGEDQEDEEDENEKDNGDDEEEQDTLPQQESTTSSSPITHDHTISTTSMALDPTHKDRLLKSLSTMHTLTEELVPSPLFSRLRKSATIIPEPGSTDSEFNGGPTRSTSSKPLPPLPFNHKTTFQMLGTRIVQMPKSTPVRKTTVQTLIARYDGLLPFPPSPTSSDPVWSPSPITPRFQKIKEAFSPNPYNRHLEAYLYHGDLSHYNASLAEFRHQLRNHISFIHQQLHQAQAVQAEHAQSKTLTQTRLASFWSLSAAAASSHSTVRDNTPRRANGGGSTRASGPPTDPNATATSNNRKARIERLRRNGWAVSKEHHGFKGEQHYEGLRRIAERELEACSRLHTRLTHHSRI